MREEFDGFLIIKQIKEPWLWFVLFKAVKKRLEDSRIETKSCVSPHISFVL